MQMNVQHGIAPTARWGELLLPQRFTAQFDEPGRPFTVALSVEVRNGQPLCTRIECTARDDAAILGEALGRLPVAQYVRLASVAAAMSKNEDGSYGPVDEADTAALEDALRVIGKRRFLITDKHLQEVASVYDAQTSTGAPVRAVAEHFSTSKKNASKWVKAARERGFVKRGFVTFEGDGE